MKNWVSWVVGFFFACFLIIIILVSLFLYWHKVMIKQPSVTYDCDDAALAIVKECEAHNLGYQIVVGNLDMENEKPYEVNHVWVIVEGVAVDWGYPCFDKQHYEGYIISKEELLQEVEGDRLS